MILIYVDFFRKKITNCKSWLFFLAFRLLCVPLLLFFFLICELVPFHFRYLARWGSVFFRILKKLNKFIFNLLALIIYSSTFMNYINKLYLIYFKILNLKSRVQYIFLMKKNQIQYNFFFWMKKSNPIFKQTDIRHSMGSILVGIKQFYHILYYFIPSYSDSLIPNQDCQLNNLNPGTI